MDKARQMDYSVTMTDGKDKIHDQSVLRDFRARCGAWLDRLADAARTLPAALLVAEADPMAALSPRKRDAHRSRTDGDSIHRHIARRALGRFLALHVAQIVGGRRLFDACAVPEPSVTADSAALFDVGRALRLASFTDLHHCDLPAVRAALDDSHVWREIAVLPDALYTPALIAAVPQMIAGWSGDPLRKRAGIFHTPAPLAHRLADLTVRESGAILDPACGGGVLLLAAFDVLIGRGLAADAALACLYGLDLDPAATDMTRLALACRGAPLTPAHLAHIWARVRSGHALIAATDLTAPDPAHIASMRAVRDQLFAATEGRAAFEALAVYETQAATLAHNHARHFADLAFNAPDDGQKLAAAHPFEWSLEFAEVGGFAAVLANPPFVGFNDYSGVEKALYARSFPQVYSLKSDLLYYFVARGVGLLRDGGRLGYITSRFWRSAAYAAKLRAFLDTALTVETLDDLDPATFNPAQVDACLMVAQKTTRQIPKAMPTSVASGAKYGVDAARIIARIAAASVPLSEVAECATGVQTGYDAAFMLTPDAAGRLPPELVRHALKNSDIAPFVLTDAGRAMLYVDDDLLHAAGLMAEAAVWAHWPELAAHLAPHLERLAARRRYAATFPPYLPQWPRRRALFEAAPKIVTPYKAPTNTFALDRRGYFFSTDVIAIVPRPSFARLDYLYGLLAVLNSRLATFYFRSYGKRMSGGQYDYYANPVKRLPVPRDPDPSLWARLSEIGRLGLMDDEAERVVCAAFGLDVTDLSHLF